MTITVHPTLDSMAVIYSLSAEGGADSVRFRSYVDLASSGRWIHTYNPMTSNPAALETVRTLLAVDAETLVHDTLDAFEGLGDLETAVVVLTPGAWTDRLFTDARSRRDGLDAIWFWSGAEVSRDVVVASTRAEAVRTIWRRRHGAPQTLLEFAAQEATAANAAGFVPADADDAVAEVLEIAGGDIDDHTLIGFLVGDELAEAADWRGVGLTGDEGPRTVARWLAEQTTWRDALESGWRPTRPGY